MRSRRAVVLAAACLGMMSLAGCKGPSKSEGKAGDAGVAPPDAAALVRAERQRLANLSELTSLGVIELSWHEDGQKRWEQGDLELSIVSPDRTALAVKKLGEIYLWMGSGAGRYWLFDNRGRDDRIAYVGELVNAGSGAEAVDTLLHPLLILDLAGLTPLLDDEAALGAITGDRELDAWVVNTTGRSGPLRVAFDRETLLPRRIEAIGADGAAFLVSRLERYGRIEVDGVPMGGFPRIAHRVVVRDHEGNGEALIVLDAPRGRVEEASKRLLFDFDALTRRLRPAEVRPFDP